MTGPDGHARVVAALARAFDLLQMPRYAAICRSATTRDILADLLSSTRRQVSGCDRIIGTHTTASTIQGRLRLNSYLRTSCFPNPPDTTLRRPPSRLTNTEAPNGIDITDD
jgi:hypothetical protein